MPGETGVRYATVAGLPGNALQEALGSGTIGQVVALALAMLTQTKTG